jgi:GNAT superfamily N-acetyltransferase
MSGLAFRLAVFEDLPSIVRMLAEDDLGSQRERVEEPLLESYCLAFTEIEKDSNHEMIVAEIDGEVVGTLHLIFIPSISYQGGLRAQVESVRVHGKYRGQGIGSEMMRWVVERARGRDAHLIQLTSHRSRKDAHRFYEKLGFSGSHLGMKLSLK